MWAADQLTHPRRRAIPTRAGALAAEPVAVGTLAVEVRLEIGIPIHGDGVGATEDVWPVVEGQKLIAIHVGAVDLCAGLGPRDGALDEIGADAVEFEVAEECLEAGGVKELGVKAGCPIDGAGAEVRREAVTIVGSGEGREQEFRGRAILAVEVKGVAALHVAHENGRLIVETRL